MFSAALALAVLAAASASVTAAASTLQDKPMSATVIGGQNALLADGAEALQAGRAEEGIRLTLEGLKSPAAAHDTAAAHTNLCAGYALLHRWDEALAHCNSSIALDRSNWRAFNNRAAVFAARGLFDEAISDVETGLKLAPRSSTLKESLRIIHENRRIMRRQNRKAAHA